MTNFNYAEFMYWTERIFGHNSDEYISILPDTNVWTNKDSCLVINGDYYLRHPAYRDYPVVGISQMQVASFSKWRSDRVFEVLLILAKKIDSRPDQDTNNYFTIEKYFNGQYFNYKPDTSYKYYPYFRLPTVAEYKKALLYSDSIDKIMGQKIQCSIVPCINDTLKTDPTAYITFPCLKNCYKKRYIYNLRGNVREWTSEENISIGGGWTDNKETIFAQDSFQETSQNAWTGFRNVCEWKMWTMNVGGQ